MYVHELGEALRRSLALLAQLRVALDLSPDATAQVIYIYIYVYIYVCVCVYIYIYVCIYIYVYIRIYIHICMYVHIYIYMALDLSPDATAQVMKHHYMYIYICMYTYIYICARAWRGAASLARSVGATASGARFKLGCHGAGVCACIQIDRYTDR